MFLWQRRLAAKECMSQPSWKVSVDKRFVSGQWNMGSSKYKLTPLKWKERASISHFPFPADKNGNVETGAGEAVLDYQMEAVC